MMKEPPASRLRRKPNPATRKLKLVCSFNGAFCLRPPSNKLRYIGGETRIVSVDRNIGFSKLRSKIFDLCPKLRSFSLKYQLLVPGFGIARDPDIDSDTEAPLVSIFSDDDVRCMIDEYEKLELYGKHARLWVFVCTDRSKNDYGGGDDKYGSFNTDNIDNGFVKENDDLFGNYLASDGLRRGAQLCRVEFNEKVNKNPVKNVDVGRIRCNDDSLRKMVLRQQLLAKQSECIHRVRGVNCGSGIEFATRGENNQIYDHPLCNLASEPQEDLHQGNMTGCGIENAHLQGSETCVSLAQYPNSRLHPLNPRDGNLYVEKHCLSGYNRHGTGICAWNMNHLHNSKVIPMCDYDPKQDFEISGHGAPCNLNRENIMPWVMRCCCNSQWVGSGYPVRSPSASERVWGGNQNGVRSHRFAMDARNPRVYPYQIRNTRSNQGIVRLDGRLSAAKCYPGLNTNSHFSKQGQPTGLHCSNPRKPGLTENVMEGRTGSGVSLFGNSNSKDCQLACGRAAAAVEAMKSQQDLLTGSLYESHEVPYPGVCENYCSVSINNEQFTFKQHKVDSNEQAVGDNDKLRDTGRGCSFFIHLKNGTDYLESGVASSVDLMDNLSLLTMKGGEHPAPSSLASSDVTNSLLKPQSEPLGLMDGELITVSNANKAVATNSSVLNAVSFQKDQVQEEEIQQDQPSGLSINDKDETKRSIKCSKVIGGISIDLVAFYTHLATRELQTIKNSDLEYVKELGSGTYGTVYYGKWKGSDVAIKKIKPSCFTEVSLEEDRLVADFWKEAHILGQLHHPNIVAFYGVVTDGPMNNLATVTEYMVNGSLKQVLRRKDRTIDRRKRIILAMDAAFGMEYLHEKNIVHFDLKSHNFLVNMKDPQRPVCKIGDLGLSKIKQRTLVSGGVRGTIPWMAPELLNSKNNMVTEKVDVFSFGIVMWELLTGEEPYSNMRSEEIIAGIIKGTLRPEIPSWCDPAWRSLMERCWSSDPESRPSFSEIAKELRTMSVAMNIK